MFRAANGETFLITLKSKPLFIRIFPTLTIKHQVLGSPLTWRDLLKYEIIRGRKGCKKIMGIDLQSTQLRRNKRSHENKELNKELSTTNPRILLDSTTFLHWIL